MQSDGNSFCGDVVFDSLTRDQGLIQHFRPNISKANMLRILNTLFFYQMKMHIFMSFLLHRFVML